MNSTRAIRLLWSFYIGATIQLVLRVIKLIIHNTKGRDRETERGERVRACVDRGIEWIESHKLHKLHAF